MPNDPMRTFEAERDRVIASLSHHFALGRLTLEEWNDRVDQVFQATTGDQLATVLRDLPVEPASPPQQGVRSDTTRSRDRLAGTPWAPWALTAVICLVIWLATSLAAGVALYFWPVWVIGPWGAATAARSLRHGRGAHLGQGCRF